MSDTNPSISVETLLVHQAWVRALAHSLVRDPGTADDLSQEAMLAALRAPERSRQRSEEARRVAAERFTVARMVEGTEQAYEQFLGRV